MVVEKRALVLQLLQFSNFPFSILLSCFLTTTTSCLFEMDWEIATIDEVAEVLVKNNIHPPIVECLSGELAHAYTTLCKHKILYRFRQRYRRVCFNATNW